MVEEDSRKKSIASSSQGRIEVGIEEDFFIPIYLYLQIVGTTTYIHLSTIEEVGRYIAIGIYSTRKYLPKYIPSDLPTLAAQEVPPSRVIPTYCL